MLIAALGILGSATGLEHLTAVIPGLPRMVPATALLIMLLSLSTLLQARGQRGILPAIVVAFCATLVLLAHAAMHLPAAAPWAAADSAPPLPAPWTAFMFLSLGVALICSATRHLLRQAQWIALAVLLLAVLILIGYILHDTFLYNLLPAQGTSVPTAFACLLAAIGVLAIHPGQGIMAAVSGPTPGARAARRLLLAALCMPVLLGAASGIALSAAWVDVGTVVALLVWGLCILIAYAVWYFALQLHRIDLARAIAEKEREAALARLREADAHKDNFLALIAHELRNPLAPIRAAAELLHRAASPDPVQLRRISEIIGRQVGHMTHLVDDLLDLSRVSRGELAVAKRPVDLRAVIEDALDQTRPQVARRRHRLDTDLPALRPLVCGDHQRLVQVLANLLSNAARYTPENGHIRLALRERGSAIEVSVQDDGIGIDADMLPRVFDAFTQGERKAGQAEGGLGLGLALVKQLVKLHDGEIRVESAGPGKGSTFVLVLPRLDDPAAGAPSVQDQHEDPA
ncbi:hypothetical protein B0920_19565 [Massilia sp. KIM]|uniref:sensor histidine kinase n=1 Tax=Massilia sp. KIM TaxID=1955422 RepID=UPI00098EA42F|nr:HAMP domain-containing sensor histidine kinase [Massilia sp. KIM]OON61125.1 hypothetical protein B0920_19565 [Massilia sp. KIM]